MFKQASRRRGIAAAALLGLTAAPLAVLAATPAAQATPSSDALVISEAYGGGGNSGATLTNDFIELYNPTTAPISVDGMSVQYRSGTGTANASVTALRGSVPAGGHYLIQQAAGAGGTQSLPNPDATGNIAMGSASFTVFLAAGTTAMNPGRGPVATSADGPIVDLISANSNVFETAAGPGTSNTTSTSRSASGADTDNNLADLRTGAPTPENSGIVTAYDPGNRGANLDEPIAPFTLGATGGTGDYTWDAIDLPAGIMISDAGEVSGTPTETGTFEVEATVTDEAEPAGSASVNFLFRVSDPDVTTLINDVQGAGATSPVVGTRLTVEAVVTSVITADDVIDGFFLQEEDADADADSATSEGVYVLCEDGCPAALSAGDKVRATGVVEEEFTSTRISAADGGAVEVLPAGEPLPSTTVVELPAETSTRASSTFEYVEGMRTTISTTLAVSEYFNLARFGEVVLTAGERPFQFTQTNAPSVEGYNAFLADLATKRIVLDDDSNDANDATSGPLSDEPYYYPSPGLSTENYFRGGDTITNLTGAMEYSFGQWRLRPIAGEDYTFESTNPRPAAPDAVGGRLKVASFNVLNYFATVDTTSSDDDGTCGPSGTADCRGADSEAERQRQLAKIVAALKTIDADVFGLIEIQNDEGLATQQIVDALNAATAPGTYDYIQTGTIGTDAIKQAFLFKTATVSPVGEFETLTTEDDERFVDTSNRPALIQTFEENSTGERVTVAVNHFKSKGSSCGAGDDSTQDGSGNCDGTRTEAAEALADYLATDPTGSGDPDFLIIGDLNSYSQERPITTLEENGFIDQLERFEGLESYGYVFDGQLGHLDHALATSSLSRQITGAGGWKINADEIPLFDYNDTVRDAGEAAFERESAELPLYEANPYRSSDHDPVVVGLALAGKITPRMKLTAPAKVNPGRSVEVKMHLTTQGPDKATGEVKYSYNGTTTTVPAGRGVTRLELAPLEETTTVQVRYLGDETYARVTDSITIEVNETGGGR